MNLNEKNKTDEGLCVLSNIFPDKTPTDLSKALNTVDGNVEVACDLILNEGMTDTNHRIENVHSHKATQINQLSTMFPSVDRAAIGSVYDSNKGIIDDIISELLNFDILSSEESKDQESLEYLIKKKYKSSPVTKNDWEATSDCIKVIQQYTGIDSAAARRAYYANLNVVRAIIEIIWISNSVTQKNAEVKQEKPARGRVQSGRGFSYYKGHPAASQGLDNTNRGTLAKTTSTSADREEQMQELSDTIQANTLLKCVNPDFLKKALEFYDGSLQRTISLAFFIIERNGSKFTYGENHQSKPAPKEEIVPKFALTPRKFQGSLSKERNSQLNPSDFADLEQYELGCKMIETILTAPRLDFHGFLPNNAVKILRICLKRWWDEEMTTREFNSQKLSMTKAVNVTPLEVVTGRGIHSVGGISIVKKRIKRLLDEEKYVYWEEPSYFIVNGKKQTK